MADLTLRWGLPGHPAKFSAPILIEIQQMWERAYDPVRHGYVQLPRKKPKIWDPFGGMGGAQTIDRALDAEVYCTEIEWEWAVQSVDTRRVVCADSQKPPFRADTFQGVITSPCYGNRMADHHEAKDPCSACLGKGCGNNSGREMCKYDARRSTKGLHGGGCGPCTKCKGHGLSVRNTYRHKLGRPLTEGSAAGLQWGEPYRALHEEVWGNVWLCLEEGGLFVLNVSDHIRKGEVVPVSQWHHDTIISMPFTCVDHVEVGTRRQKMGSNANVRVGHENIFAYVKEAA